jgi:hypothetical protein
VRWKYYSAQCEQIAHDGILVNRTIIDAAAKNGTLLSLAVHEFLIDGLIYVAQSAVVTQSFNAHWYLLETTLSIKVLMSPTNGRNYSQHLSCTNDLCMPKQ